MQRSRKGHSPSRPESLEGRVRDVTQSGESVVETAQGIVLVHRGGFPGEHVRVRSESRSKGVRYGTLEAVLDPVAERTQAPCDLAERCGGCPLMGLGYSAQQQLKLERVRREIAGVSAPGVTPVLEDVGAQLGYRRRVRLSYRRVAGRTLLGYRAGGSHTIIDVPTCLVLEEALAQALSHTRELLAPQLSDQGEIEICRAHGEGAVVLIAAATPLAPAAYGAAEALSRAAGISGVGLRVGQGAPATYGKLEQASVGFDGEPLRAPAGVFAQANDAVNRRLVGLVHELAQPSGARVLELFAGHGNFTIALAREAASLCAVEGEACAAQACRDNLKARGHAAARVIASDANDVSVRSGPADVIVLDPPRSGAPSLAALVAQKKPARIVYVSCHMTTLGRDLRALAELGYRADRAHALDMFPHTAHVEAVVRMRMPEPA